MKITESVSNCLTQRNYKEEKCDSVENYDDNSIRNSHEPKRSNSVRQNIFIKNDDKEEDYSNFSKTLRTKTSISLVNNEKNDGNDSKYKNEYIYSTLYNPMAYNRLNNIEKKEILMRYYIFSYFILFF